MGNDENKMPNLSPSPLLSPVSPPRSHSNAGTGSGLAPGNLKTQSTLNHQLLHQSLISVKRFGPHKRGPVQALSVTEAGALDPQAAARLDLRSSFSCSLRFVQPFAIFPVETFAVCRQGFPMAERLAF